MIMLLEYRIILEIDPSIKARWQLNRLALKFHPKCAHQIDVTPRGEAPTSNAIPLRIYETKTPKPLQVLDDHLVDSWSQVDLILGYPSEVNRKFRQIWIERGPTKGVEN